MHFYGKKNKNEGVKKCVFCLFSIWKRNRKL